MSLCNMSYTYLAWFDEPYWFHRLVDGRVVRPSYHVTRRIAVNPSSGGDVIYGADAEDGTEDTEVR